ELLHVWRIRAARVGEGKALPKGSQQSLGRAHGPQNSGRERIIQGVERDARLNGRHHIGLLAEARRVAGIVKRLSVNQGIAAAQNRLVVQPVRRAGAWSKITP